MHRKQAPRKPNGRKPNVRKSAKLSATAVADKMV
jgi:hypothetical protein